MLFSMCFRPLLACPSLLRKRKWVPKTCHLGENITLQRINSFPVNNWPVEINPPPNPTNISLLRWSFETPEDAPTSGASTPARTSDNRRARGAQTTNTAQMTDIDSWYRDRGFLHGNFAFVWSEQTDENGNISRVTFTVFSPNATILMHSCLIAVNFNRSMNCWVILIYVAVEQDVGFNVESLSPHTVCCRRNSVHLENYHSGSFVIRYGHGRSRTHRTSTGYHNRIEMWIFRICSVFVTTWTSSS